jgi:hypothetical protein
MSTWCRHRTPFTSEFKTCKIGVDFHKFPRQHDLMPCLGQTAEAKALCPKYSGYTSEEIEAHEKSLAESLDRMAIIRQAIIANVKATGQRQGRIPCPACKTGTVGYSQASNGHVHARCSTEGCASWME